MTDWTCPVCHSPVALLGTLGSRTHGRCTACGLDHSRIATPMPYAVTDPDNRVFRDEACCGSCDAGFACECEDEPAHQEDQILRDEENAGLTPEELADGQAQFDAFFSNDMKTRP